MDWITFLKVMIEDEKAAASKYQLALDEANSPELETVLEKLLHEEQFHVDFLEQEIRRLQSA
ncbi:MAG: ferritin-like domain-containing protein [Anaerolineae bacterium]|nr:ferritin-like domain-containing protein [Anaerolineae bacterium]